MIRHLAAADSDKDWCEEERQIVTKYLRSGHREIGGTSEVINDLRRRIKIAAKANVSRVLITGESGTGKELFAHAIHQWSPRAKAPFVAVHCAALNENLLESELFGHEKGAYTDASERFIGRFERADHGTLFLDEIGEISLPTQVKLLRVLENRCIARVGGSATIPIDVRLVAATNRDLRQRIAEGRFREDLFYRLNVIPIQMPPLRARTGDIPTLFAHFLHRFNEENGKAFDGIDPAAMETLLRYSWPGNVRELENVVERMVVLGHGTRLGLDDVPADIRAAVDAPPQGGAQNPVATPPPARESIVQQPQNSAAPLATGNGKPETAGESAPPISSSSLYAGTSLADAAKSQILSVLDACGGNRSQAAARLGISRRTLHRKLAAWGIQKY
jgi:DNA-binding NtrC family response regulator